MKAFILAAGRGTRISRHINGKPKCTVQLSADTTLIRHTVESLLERGIREIVLVLGYRSDAVLEALSGLPIQYRVNPFFDVTNSIASLWFARDMLDASQPTIMMNGDVFLSDEALDAVLAERCSPVLFYDSSRILEADYKFGCDGERLVRYGKELTPEQTSGEYVGCAVFSAAYTAQFIKRLEEMIASQRHSAWWEDVLYSMADESTIIARDIAGVFWGEVDFVEDYDRIMAFYGKLIAQA